MYVQSGNVLAADLALSEGMTEWVPVSQVLGNIPATPMNMAAPVAATEPQLVPLPPNWHWALILILGLVTRQLFNFIWAFIQANWARKLSADNKPLVLVAMYPAGMIAGIFATALFPRTAPVGVIFILGGAIAYLFGVFSIKHAMEQYYTTTENFGLQMSGVMTFFFGTIYIQYHINSIARWKKTVVLK
jgi:hypothetical protein